MKKILKTLLLIMIVVTAMSAELPVKAAISGDYGYEVLEDGTAEVTSYTGSDTEIVVPEKIAGYQVTHINTQAFADCDNLESIIISEGVTNIEAYAFDNCSSLKNIIIPESVTSIDEGAFAGCSSLENITISGSVTYIGESVFAECSNLKNVTLQEGIVSISPYLFEGCYSLKSIMIPASVTKISNAAFSECDNLSSINVSVNSQAFTSLDGIVFNKDMTTLMICPVGIEKTSYIIPDGVKHIGKYAFAGCTGLTDIIIPEGVTNIEAYAFNNCRSLRTMIIPESVTSIENGAFYFCPDLESIIISEGVTKINAMTFFGCRSLRTMIIPESVTSIESGAFFSCTDLESILIENPECTIPNSESVIPEETTIYGYRNSKAQTYAENNDRAFVALEDIQEQLIYHYPLDSESAVSYHPTDSFYISKKLGYYFVDKENPWGTNGILDVTGIDIDVQFLEITGADENGWWIKAKRPGITKVTISHEAFDSEKAVEQTFLIDIKDEWYQISLSEISGVQSVIPGDQLKLKAGAIRKYYDEAADGIASEIAEDITFVWSVKDEEMLPGTVTIDANGEITDVTIGEDFLGYNDTMAIVAEGYQKVDGEQIKIAEELFVISIADEAYELEVKGLPEVIVLQGESVKLQPIFKKRTMDQKEPEALDNVKYSFVWYEDQLDICDSKGNAILPEDTCLDSEYNVTKTAAGNIYFAVYAEFETENGEIIQRGCTLELVAPDEVCEHEAVTDEAVPATCTETGLSEGSHCAVCKEVLAAQEEIPALGHTWSAWKTKFEATVFAAEVELRKCSACGKEETRAGAAKLTPTMETNAKGDKLTFKKNQKTAGFEITGLAKGDSVESITSSNQKVVKVSQVNKTKGTCTLKAGKLTGKKGKAEITIILKSGLKKTIKVTVQAANVKTSAITNVAKKLTLKKRETFTLKPVLVPFTSSDKITYQSSNQKVVTVTAKGKLKAKKNGKATITVKAGKKTVKVKVTVK